MSVVFPVSHSVLDEGALDAWLSSLYGLKDVRCRLYRRSMSDTYLVEAGDARYFFKVGMYGRHDRTAVEGEVAFACDLCDAGISVTVPLERCDGMLICDIPAPEGVRYGVLYRAVTGEAPQETNLTHSRQFGRLAAQIHDWADRSGRTYARWHLDENHLVRGPIREMKPYLAHRPADLACLRQLGEDLIVELRALLSKQLPEYGLCHGDLHTGNACFDGNGKLVLFDLDSFGYGWRALDIGVYRVSYDWMGLSRECRETRDRFWAAFLDGYQEVRALRKNELSAIALALPIRHLELMGLTMRYWASHQGTHWITDAYFDQHVNWFRRWAEEYR